MSNSRSQAPWQKFAFTDFAAPQDVAPIAALSSEEDTLAMDAPVEQELVTAADTAQQQGYDTGFTQGQTEGYQQGYDTGYQAGLAAAKAQADHEHAQINTTLKAQADQLIQNLQHAMTALETSMLDKLVDIAMLAAKQVVDETLHVDRQHLVTKIHRLFDQQPIFQGAIELCVNPSDKSMIETQLGETLARFNWQLVVDPRLKAGDFKLISSEGELDATQATAWETIQSIVKNPHHPHEVSK